jgi:hypothetical protein
MLKRETTSSLCGMGFKNLQSRNIEIAVKVLSGGSLGRVASEYGLIAERARQIVNKYCRAANPDAYSANFKHFDGLRGLRKNKDLFLPGIEARNRYLD